MFAARQKRDPLELDLPERRVMLDEKGRITSIAPRDRLDAHRLVEDFMIAANVAAARALEAKKSPVMYRVHEPPSREKLVALKDYLATFGIEFALGQVIKPGTFNRIIERVGDGDGREEIMEQLLRTQMQARYGPERLGHFGLALATYAHFTSPIRRYADLLVHRALVSAYRLGEGGLAARRRRALRADRRADLDARAARDGGRARDRRPLCRGLPRRPGRPVGRMPDHRRAAVRLLRHGRGSRRRRAGAREGPRPGIFPLRRGGAALVGDESGETYRVGQRLTLRLAEANPVSGSLRFELPEGSYGGGSAPPRRDRVRDRQPRPAGEYPPHNRSRRCTKRQPVYPPFIDKRRSSKSLRPSALLRVWRIDSGRMANFARYRCSVWHELNHRVLPRRSLADHRASVYYITAIRLCTIEKGDDHDVSCIL